MTFDRQLDPADIPDFESIHEIEITNAGYKLSLQVEDIVGILPELEIHFKKRNLNITLFESRKMTLDDLFISMTGRHLET